MLKAGNTRTEINIGNTMEYDVKLSKIKVTRLKRTKIIAKGLMVNRSQKNIWHGQRVCDAMM